jgi:ectoine hydroxylase-related dioxygenase (phytanoyl-CoA dioxygenase family)
MLDELIPGRWRRLLSRQSGEAAAPAPCAVTPDQKRFFDENGFLILPGFFAPAAMDALKTHLDRLWESRAEQPNIVIDAHYGLPQEERTRFRRVSPEVRRFPYKLLDLHLDDDPVRDLCGAQPLMDVLRALLGANPIVCNSLLFEKGSQQDAHFDTFFMPSKTPNMMAASWIALDSVTEDSGPVYYYPKSHLIEPYRFSHGGMNAIFAELPTGAAGHIETIIERHGLTRELFLPRQGDVLIWHAQLLHGGSTITNPEAKRCSLVTHYWTDIDFPDAAQRIDLGDGRWILRRDHQHVVDSESLAEVDAFLATVTVTDAMRDAVPALFDPRLYLARNQDVLRAGENPWRHYLDHGRAEGRVW